MIKWLFSVLKCQKNKFETFNWKLITISSVHKWLQFGQSGICEEKYEKKFCQKKSSPAVPPTVGCFSQLKACKILSSNSIQIVNLFHLYYRFSLVNIENTAQQYKTNTSLIIATLFFSPPMLLLQKYTEHIICIHSNAASSK